MLSFQSIIGSVPCYAREPYRFDIAILEISRVSIHSAADAAETLHGVEIRSNKSEFFANFVISRENIA